MKPFLAVAVLAALLSGCLGEPDYRNYGQRPHEWKLPGPDYERKVFGPMPYDEVKDFVREKESDGWEMVGFEPASLSEDVMIDTTELDRPSPRNKPPWRFDIPKTMDDRTDPPKKEKTVPPYLDEDVKAHRQKYLVIMRRWL